MGSNKSSINHYINGVNWSVLKRFAKFYFGTDNILSFRNTENRQYFIYMEKNFYNKNLEAVAEFEKVWLVNIKPQEA